MSRVPAPDGYCWRRGSDGEQLLVCAAREPALIEAGLHRSGTWERHLAAGGTGAGRGRTATHQLADGTLLRLKRMKRGGLLGPLWRDRYPGRRRLVGNVTLALQAIARGVRTPRPVSLLMREGPPGLFRAWLAFEEIEGTRTLLHTLDGNGADDAAMAMAMNCVRAMHDRGVEHRDLNLGNILVDPDRARAWVIDLDRSRVHRGGLTRRARLRALARMARSYRKHLAPDDRAARKFADRSAEIYGLDSGVTDAVPHPGDRPA